MALPLGRAKPDALFLRIASAAVLAPVALYAAWQGPPVLSVLSVLAAAVMGWEWGRLCGGGRFGAVGQLTVASEFLGVGAAAAGWFLSGLTALAVGAIAVSLVTFGQKKAAPWGALGVLWIGIPAIALIWLRLGNETGRATVLWIFALVWATDSAAYAVGRAIGGPRLMPRWSPKKTWSGLLGGVAAAGLVGIGAAYLTGARLIVPVLAVSLCLGAIEQLGDLMESMAKRHFGVKDTSGLIPGHGGLLDRLDGMLVVVFAAAAITLLSGYNVIAWQ
jgi:phosphatidate cytidylyltransferase